VLVQYFELGTLPFAIIDFTQIRYLDDWHITLCHDSLGCFERTVEGAGIDCRQGNIMQTLCYSLGLLASFFIEVYAWNPSSQAPMHPIIGTMTNQ
jgi:hypothetical protein